MILKKTRRIIATLLTKGANAIYPIEETTKDMVGLFGSLENLREKVSKYVIKTGSKETKDTTSLNNVTSVEDKKLLVNEHKDQPWKEYKQRIDKKGVN